MIYYEGKNHYHAGDVVNVPESVAAPWLRDGRAMQDKSLDGPSETKVMTHPVASDAEIAAAASDVELTVASWALEPPREKLITTAPAPTRAKQPAKKKWKR